MLESTAGVIVAGGGGVRLGGSKPLAPFGRGVLLDAVIARVRPQVEPLALNIASSETAAYRAHFGAVLPLLIDPIQPSVGPLGGVLAGLEWVRQTAPGAWLASFPCDTPFLPLDLVAQLRASVATEVPIAAEDTTRVHGLCAIWPPDCIDELRRGLESGRLRSVMSAVEALGGSTRRIVCEPDAFFNINTREDLTLAESISARRNIP